MSITLQSIINYARVHTKLQPLVNIGGLNSVEPAVSIANDTKSKIMSRPYAWKWNRAAHIAFLTNTTTRTEDYVMLANDLGWLERGYMEDYANTSTPKPRYPLECVRTLNKGWEVGQPMKVAVERDERGIDVIRLYRIPDLGTQFNVFLDYQRKPVLLTALTDNFDPIPDEYQGLIRQFFMAYCFRLIDDKRANTEIGRAEQMLDELREYDDSTQQHHEMMIPDRPLMMG
jgi:hypothetical protein